MTVTDIAREAYAIHREALEVVGTEDDPGPWENLPLAVRDTWIAWVEGLYAGHTSNARAYL